MDEEFADIGPHVGLKRLIAYRQGTLPASEREDLQEHLSLCRRCTGRLLELRDFEAASAEGSSGGPEFLREEAWESLARRLPLQTPAARSTAGPRPVRQSTSRFAYAMAAALLLAIVGLSMWAAVTIKRERQRLSRLEQQLKEREQALAAARGRIQGLEKKSTEPADRKEELEARVAELTSELEELRRATKAPEARDRITAASPPIAISVAPFFVLRNQEPPSFLRSGGTVNSVPLQEDRVGVKLALVDHPLYGEYRIELLNQEGQVLWTGRRPGRSLLGDAGTTVSIQGIGPGLYTLRIEGLHPDRTDLLASYLVEVARTAASARD